MTLSSRGRLARWLRVNSELLEVDRYSHLYAWWVPEEREVLGDIAATACLPFVVSDRLVALAFIATVGGHLDFTRQRGADASYRPGAPFDIRDLPGAPDADAE